MPGELREKLAIFLRQRKGDETFARFARKLGFSQSTLHRLMHKHQSATLGKVEQIMDRLKCSYQDIFGIELPPTSVKESSKPKLPPSPSGLKYLKKKPKSAR